MPTMLHCQKYVYFYETQKSLNGVYRAYLLSQAHNEVIKFVPQGYVY